jgi:hypothetical protein
MSRLNRKTNFGFAFAAWCHVAAALTSRAEETCGECLMVIGRELSSSDWAHDVSSLRLASLGGGPLSRGRWALAAAVS